MSGLRGAMSGLQGAKSLLLGTSKLQGATSRLQETPCKGFEKLSQALLTCVLPFWLAFVVVDCTPLPVLAHIMPFTLTFGYCPYIAKN